MTDILDAASDYIEASTSAAIQQIRSRALGIGSSHCDECGEEIPLARRQRVPNTRHCVDCATQLEEKAKRYGKY